MDQSDEILVTGGTGRAGSAVVHELRERGRSVRVLTRGRHARQPLDGVAYVTCDLVRNEGVAEAFHGARVVVHCAASVNPAANRQQWRNVIAAARRGGTVHLVSLSVVGADRVPTPGRFDRMLFGYFPLSRELEGMVARSGLPWSIVRATQFYELVLIVARTLTKLPVIPAPTGFRFQPIDTRDVAARVADVALGEPSGLGPDVAGPRIYDIEELLRSYLQAAHKRRRMLRLHLPGRAAQAIRHGANLAPDHAVGHRTWEDFLQEHFSASTARP